MSIAAWFLIISVIVFMVVYWWLDSGIRQMEEDNESYDEYLAEQCRLSYEMKKQFGGKPNHLTQINALREVILKKNNKLEENILSKNKFYKGENK